MSHRPLNLGWWLLALVALPTQAQVVPDATLGTGNNSVTTTTGDRTDITGGLRRSSALFHSFDRFSIETNRQVYFANPAGIRNIFSRVTGSNISNINGLLGVSGSANLFLMNPNGIIFGPNARLDVSGSFLATTANVLEFPDGQKFAATGDRAVPLVEVNIPVGLQLGANSPAMLRNEGNLTTGQDLTLAAGNLELQGQLQAGNNLTLQAADTVKIRDSATQPFVARSTGDLKIQGDRSVDIFALNHPNSGLIANGNLVLRSENTIIGDAHYWSGGNFRVEKLDGNPGNLFSPHDPVILATGDVNFSSYSGASLHILAGGSVTITGNVEILSPDGTNGLVALVPLSDGSFVSINGKTQSTLDIRAGSIPAGAPSLTPNPISGAVGTINPNSPRSGANIQIGSITNTRVNGQILLSTYDPANPSLSGGIIELTGADANGQSITAFGNPVTIDSRGDIRIANGINSSVDTGPGSELKLLSRGSIDTTGGFLNTAVFQGVAGDITLKAGTSITTGGIQSRVGADRLPPDPAQPNDGNGTGGNILLDAGTTITTQGVILSKVDRAGNAGNISLNANGAINAQQSIESTTASGNGGDISINATQLITANNIRSRVDPGGTGRGGAISVISSGGAINLANRSIDSTSNFNGRGGSITLEGTAINTSGGTITSRNDTAGLTGGVGGDVNLRATVGDIRAADILASSNNSMPLNSDGDINLTANAGSIFLDQAKLSTSNIGTHFAGDIRISAANQIRITGNSAVGSDGYFGTLTLTGTASNSQITIQDSQITAAIPMATALSATQQPQSQISLNANRVTIDNSQISTKAEGFAADPSQFRLANSGNVLIRGNTLKIIDNSRIETETSSGVTGNSGNISIGTSGTTVDTSTVNLENSSFTTTAGGLGNSGNIAITANQTITAIDSSLRTTTVSDSNTSGSAGSVTITSEAASDQAIQLTNTGIDAAAFGTGGQTGSVTIAAPNRGDVSLTGSRTIFTDTFGSQPTGELTVRGGTVLIDGYRLNARVNSTGVTGGNILVDGNTITMQNGSLITTETSGGTGGTVTLQTTGGKIAFVGDGITDNDAGAVRTTVNAGATGSGGNITIDSNGGQIEFSNGFQVNSATKTTNPSASAGKGGDVLVTSNGGKVIVDGNSEIDASTSGNQIGGDVTVLSGNQSIQLNSGSIKTTVEQTSTANGGLIRIESDGNTISLGSSSGTFEINAATAADNTSGTHDSKGRGGTIDLTTNGGQISVVNKSTINASTSGSGDAGNVTVAAANLRLEDSKILSESTNLTSNAASGNITLSGLATLQLDNSKISASTVQGRAGNLLVNEGSTPVNSIRLTNDSELSLAASGNGQAGNIRLNTQQLSLNQSKISAKTEGDGAAGEIQVSANGAPIDFIALTNQSKLEVDATGSGNAGLVALATRQLTLQDSNIRASTNTGEGNNIVLNGLNTLQLNDSTITASTQDGRAGNLFVNEGGTPANAITFNNSTLEVKADGSGKAGFVSLTAGEITLQKKSNILASTNSGEGNSIVLNGLNTLQLNDSRIAAFTNTGVAGNLSITATGNVDLQNSSLSVAANQNGRAGNLDLQAGRVRVNQSDITVSSKQGQAGNLSVTTSDLRLNRGTLSAETATGGNGANITIATQAPLILRHVSKITASAREQANGGNITISAPFVIGQTFEDSDIIANAIEGRGGNITITTAAIFGLQFRPKLTPLSDITASSEFGTNGSVALNTLNIDPNRGLIKVQTDLVDRTNQITQGCADTGSSETSQLTIAGQSGVRLSPTMLLPAQASPSDWVSLNPPTTTATLPVEVAEPSAAVVCVNSWKAQQRSQLE